ncbi:MAG: DNA repair protein RecN [Eudoraea sp.]|nr:DNA repair protein RecN [Eudoraea sp.]
MLASISIKNYALINDLQIDFGRGLNTITGETGAGKSILLGGLSMVLGKRADMAALRDKTRKCIIEAQFEIQAYDLKSIFEKNDLDYHPTTWIRREIHPNGRSRAFINDTPVTLDVLNGLSRRLIDVHSQHATIELTEEAVQLKVIDALAGNQNLRLSYQETLDQFNELSSKRDHLLEEQREAVRELDYNQFLLQELDEAQLEPGMQESLEEQQGALSNVENIKTDLAAAHQLLHDETIGVLGHLAQLRQITDQLSSYGSDYDSVNSRIRSVHIELDDLAGEFLTLQEGLEADPELLETINSRLQVLYSLLKKHNALHVDSLLEIKENLAMKVDNSAKLESQIEHLNGAIQETEEKLIGFATDLHVKRDAVMPRLIMKLEDQLKKLGMPNASFALSLEQSTTYKRNGKDNLIFKFTANKGSAHGDLKKVASGGELSRIMLSIKSILAEYETLPTLVFDEIDTGVSGEISNAMAQIMKAMSTHMQIFSITHLPQVASKGDLHYKVYKEDVNEVTQTRIKLLTEDERIVELAEMLGGKTLSDSAMAHARQLLN